MHLSRNLGKNLPKSWPRQEMRILKKNRICAQRTTKTCAVDARKPGSDSRHVPRSPAFVRGISDMVWSRGSLASFARDRVERSDRRPADSSGLTRSITEAIPSCRPQPWNAEATRIPIIEYSQSWTTMTDWPIAKVWISSMFPPRERSRPMCRVLRFPGCVRLCRTVGFRMESWTCSGFLRLRIAISPARILQVSRTVLPVAAERRAAARISVTTRLFSSDDRPRRKRSRRLSAHPF